MPRLACSDAKEYRFTLGDFERTQLKKEIEQNHTLEYVKVLAKPVLYSTAAVTSAWFIGKGIAGIWDDIASIFNPFDNETDPETGLRLPPWFLWSNAIANWFRTEQNE